MDQSREGAVVVGTECDEIRAERFGGVHEGLFRLSASLYDIEFDAPLRGAGARAFQEQPDGVFGELAAGVHVNQEDAGLVGHGEIDREVERRHRSRRAVDGDDDSRNRRIRRV